MKTHHYAIQTEWTGNVGSGTSAYTAYSRDHRLGGVGKTHTIDGSSDPAFRGDAARYNPEELLISSLSACHMLWYLHLCAANGIVVTAYTDGATGVMDEAADGGGQFREVTLNPMVIITNANQIARATALHAEAGALCYIARSCNFPVRHQPVVQIEGRETPML